MKGRTKLLGQGYRVKERKKYNKKWKAKPMIFNMKWTKLLEDNDYQEKKMSKNKK